MAAFVEGASAEEVGEAREEAALHDATDGHVEELLARAHEVGAPRRRRELDAAVDADALVANREHWLRSTHGTAVARRTEASCPNDIVRRTDSYRYNKLL